MHCSCLERCNFQKEDNKFHSMRQKRSLRAPKIKKIPRDCPRALKRRYFRDWRVYEVYFYFIVVLEITRISAIHEKYPPAYCEDTTFPFHINHSVEVCYRFYRSYWVDLYVKNRTLHDRKEIRILSCVFLSLNRSFLMSPSHVNYSIYDFVTKKLFSKEEGNKNRVDIPVQNIIRRSASWEIQGMDWNKTRNEFVIFRFYYIVRLTMIL